MTPERLALNHEVFSAAELQPHIEARIHNSETAQGQTIRIIETDARSGEGQDYEHTIIWPAAFQARADMINIQRMRILAQELKAKVLFMETPGVSVDIRAPKATTGAQATKEQVQAALRGNFRPHAAAQLQALHETVPFEDGEQLHVIGYSMGATMAAYLAQQLGEQPFGSDISLSIARLDFIDPVNDQDWNMPKLIAAIRKEGKADKAYIDENKALNLEPNPYGLATENEARRMRQRLEIQQAMGIYSVAAGLRKGFSPILQQAINESRDNETTRLHEADITFYRANASSVGREAAHQQTADELQKYTDFVLRRVELTKPSDEPLHHPFPRSTARLMYLAREEYRRYS